MAITKNKQQGTEQQLEAAVRRYLRAVDKALPYLDKLLTERSRMDRLREQEGRDD